MNKLFVIYDSLTGKIIRIGSCTEEELSLQVNDGECMLVDVQADPRTQCIDVKTKELISAPAGKGTPSVATPSISKIDDLINRVALLEKRVEALEKGG